MIIHPGKFEAVIALLFLVIFSFTLAVSCENESATAVNTNEAVELPVIMYHHITESESKTGKYTVHKKEFERDLEYIKSKGYTTVTVKDLIAFADRTADLPDKPIMITFDDGFESFYKIAYPLLNDYKMKAVVSVIGSVTEKYSETEDHNINYSNLNWEEISELHNSGLVEIQNHSYDMHKSDTKNRKGISKLHSESEEAYKGALSSDLNRLQQLLYENCGFRPTAVAYPYGAFSNSTLSIIKECGFRCTFLCEERVNIIIRGNSDSLYGLGRYNRESGISTALFFDRFE